MIKIYEPYKLQNSLKLITEAIEDTEITYQGKHHVLCQKKMSNFFEEEVILVANGTCSTHLLSDAIKIKNKNIKKLIVPNNVYVAAWNSFLFGKNQYELIPVDADLETWNFDINKLQDLLDKSDPQETAVLIVHNIGNTINVPKLIRHNPNFIFVEDNCEGFTGKYEGYYTGTKSLASSISFYANKIITCGEGGAFISSDKQVIETINKIYSQGQTQERYIHDILAYNYRLTNLQSSMLLSQMSLIEEILEKKKKIWNFYDHNLNKKFLKQKKEEGCEPSLWMYSVRVEDFNYHKELKNNNIEFETRPMFYPISFHEHLKEYGVFEDKNAKKLSDECFMIPSHPNLSESDLETIVNFLNKI